eukprot:1704114-Prymnesium_polylepis.1
MATLNLTHGFWRLSTATSETHYCRSNGGWSPCRGGVDAGHEGDGYCKPGHRGPRCELCSPAAGESEHSRYFNKLDAHCHSCGDVKAQLAAVAGSVLLFMLLVFVGIRWTLRQATRSKMRNCLPTWINSARELWRTAGMQFKVKALVGLYQCVAAIPSVFDVTPPEGLEEYTRWIDVIELPSSWND